MTRVNLLRHPHARARRGGAMPTDLLDLLEPPGRCSGAAASPLGPVSRSCRVVAMPIKIGPAPIGVTRRDKQR